MEARALGKTGLSVSVIGMGTWQSYDVRGPAEVQPVTDAVLEHGATFFDTSPMYGAAERVLAQTLGTRRRGVIIATKVWAGSAREGREQIRRALDWYGSPMCCRSPAAVASASSSCARWGRAAS